MAQKTRIVADPNVWVSALISPSGAPAGVLRAVLSDEVVAVATPHLLDELRAVLERDKFRRWVSLADARAYVAALAQKVDLWSDVGPAAKPITRDPGDDYLAVLAADAQATIVTGDDDLLDADLDPPAMTPRQFLNWLRSQR